MFESVGCQRRVAYRRRNAAVTQVVLDCPGVLAVVGKLVAAAVPQHVAMGKEGKPSRLIKGGRVSIGVRSGPQIGSAEGGLSCRKVQ
jgi:hypothetical protein